MKIYIFGSKIIDIPHNSMHFCCCCFLKSVNIKGVKIIKISLEISGHWLKKLESVKKNLAKISGR